MRCCICKVILAHLGNGAGVVKERVYKLGVDVAVVEGEAMDTS